VSTLTRDDNVHHLLLQSESSIL